MMQGNFVVNGVDLRDLRGGIENGYQASSATVLDLIDEVIRRRADDLARRLVTEVAAKAGVEVEDVERRLNVLIPLGVRVLGLVSYVLDWVSEAEPGLGGRTPAELLASDAGLDEVRRLLMDSTLDQTSGWITGRKLATIEAAVPRDVRKLLSPLPIGSRLQFYSTGKGSLGGLTPIQALAAGKVAAVRRAAQGFLER